MESDRTFMAFYDELDAVYADGGDVLSFLREKEDALLAGGKGGGAEHVIVLNERGAFFQGVSRYAEASAAYREAIEIIGRIEGKRSLNYAATLGNHATTKRMMGDIAAAKTMYEEALGIYEDLPEKSHYHYAGALNNFGALYLQEGDLLTAIGYMRRAIKLLAQDDGLRGELATAKTNLASIMMEAGDRAAAEAELGEALAIFEDGLLPHAHYPAALNVMALLKADRSPEEALQLWTKALEYTYAVFGENADYAAEKHNLGLLLLRMGRPDEARAFLGDALAVTSRIFGADHEKTAAVRADYESALPR
jgi:tetratricopeptide (TPR) repeat protein